MKTTHLALIFFWIFNSILRGQQSFQSNDFKIGHWSMSMKFSGSWDCNATNLLVVEIPTYVGYPSSSLNVLAQKGFNIIMYPSNSGDNFTASMIRLVKNNGMQILLGLPSWYKPTVTTTNYTYNPPCITPYSYSNDQILKFR